MAPTDRAEQRPERENVGESVVAALLGPNPFVGFTGQDVLRAIQWIGEHALLQPRVVVEQQAALARELIGVLAGQSTLAPEPGDRRFQDPTWSTSPLYRGWM